MERHSWGVRQWRGETHTYVEVCGTVKAVLIGHHTSGETEWQGGEEGGSREELGGRQSEKQDESGVVRPHVGIEGTGREGGAMIEGREKEWQADCEEEKRKKGEIITHRATCKTKYHLVVNENSW